MTGIKVVVVAFQYVTSVRYSPSKVLSETTVMFVRYHQGSPFQSFSMMDRHVEVEARTPCCHFAAQNVIGFIIGLNACDAPMKTVYVATVCVQLLVVCVVGKLTRHTSVKK